jgi:alpha-beta hydrolase superfamily lysophospholipase
MIAGYFFARQMTATNKITYPDILQLDSFKVEQKSIVSTDGIKINAWFAGHDKKNAVILLPGIHANSTSMIGRAKIYLANGFSVLLVDLRGEGKSEGDAVSFGWNERHDLLACHRWLKNNGFENIGVNGCSLGAATITYSFDSITNYKFVVLESPYDNIDHALAHRTFNSGFNRFLFWPAYFFTEEKTGVNPDDLSPLNCVSKYKGPLLYLAGDKEKNIPLEEAQSIYSACGSTNKTFRVFEGAAHVDFLNFNPTYYKASLTDFLHTLN